MAVRILAEIAEELDALAVQVLRLLSHRDGNGRAV